MRMMRARSWSLPLLRRGAACAGGSALAAVVLVNAAAAGAATAPAPGDPGVCEPAVVVEGAPEALVRDVRGALADAGVRTTASPGCDAVTARVDAQADRVLLRVRDTDGRTSERQVRTTGAAVTVIESWARRDLDQPFLRARAPQAPTAEAPSEAAAPPTPSWSLDLLGTTALGSEGSHWRGFVLGGCWRLGRVCLGPEARVASDGGAAGDSASTPTRRLAMDGALSARFPFAFGHWTVAPSVALGYGWLRTESVVVPDADGQVEAGDYVRLTSTGLRLGTSLSCTRSITRWLGLVVRADLGVAPGASTTSSDERVAGEPRAFFGLAAGLRVGAP